MPNSAPVQVREHAHCYIVPLQRYGINSDQLLEGSMESARTFYETALRPESVEVTSLPTEECNIAHTKHDLIHHTQGEGRKGSHEPCQQFDDHETSTCSYARTDTIEPPRALPPPPQNNISIGKAISHSPLMPYPISLTKDKPSLTLTELAESDSMSELTLLSSSSSGTQYPTSERGELFSELDKSLLELYSQTWVIVEGAIALLKQQQQPVQSDILPILVSRTDELNNQWHKVFSCQDAFKLQIHSECKAAIREEFTARLRSRPPT